MPEHGVGGFELGAGAVLDERSDAACALASARGRLVLAWTGADTRLNLLSSADGTTFGDKATYRHRSSCSEGSGDSSTTVVLAPALAATAGGDLHLAWTGTDARLNVWRLGLGAEGHTIVPQRSYRAPALGSWDDDVLVSWTGTDRRLNVARSAGGWFGDPWHLAATSSHAPAIARSADDVMVSWTGTDRCVNLLRWTGTKLDEPWRLEHRSGAAPALCALEDELLVAFTGGDRRINVLAVRHGALVAEAVLPATSSHGPALAVHGGRLVLGWTGADRRLNVATVFRLR